MILIIRLDNDRYGDIMLIIILCGDGYCYMRVQVYGDVSRETIGKGRGGEGERESMGFGVVCAKRIVSV